MKSLAYGVGLNDFFRTSAGPTSEINQMTEPMNQDYQTVAKIIQQRRTFKVLANVDSPVEFSGPSDQAHRATIRDAIAHSDWAPFHYDRDSDAVPQPWRFYALWSPACRTIAREFHNWFSDVKPSNKLPSMLSACGALILVNWIPQFSFGANPNGGDQKNQSREKQIQIDEEHLAATSAAVQNLLLLLTAAGMGTYWSSGGQFRTATMQQKLQIPTTERLLAAVFVEFPDSMSDIESDLQRLPGKQRDRRAPIENWMREIETI